MSNIYKNILESKKTGAKLLAVLIDPDKVQEKRLEATFLKIHQTTITHIFVGGSTVALGVTEKVVAKIKTLTKLPVILFPGHYSQITSKADGLLFLNLLSGRNPEYLVEQQINAAPIVQNTDLEVMPTGYILIDGGVVTAVQRVSETHPISQNNQQLVVNTALAGQYMGKQLLYLEAGSGAKVPVSTQLIKEVTSKVIIPVIVGGGIRSKAALDAAYAAGADLVVIGTAIEENEDFLRELENN